MDVRSRSFLMVALALALTGVVRAAVPARPPNILFVLADDLRADSVARFGNSGVPTPGMDRLTREGAWLDRLYTPFPLCCPTRAALLSGRRPGELGVTSRDCTVPASRLEPTIARTLAGAGYATGFIGKSHLGTDPREWGFRDARVWYPTGTPSPWDPELRIDGRPRVMKGWFDGVLRDEAQAWIRANRDRRWFLWYAPWTPHRNSNGGLPVLEHEVRPPRLWPRGTPLPTAAWQRYGTRVMRFDEGLASLLVTLDELGLAERTLVVVVGDNGLMWGSHGRMHKSCWFEESVRVPGFVRWPGRVPAGRVVRTPLTSLDLYASLCEAAGVRSPAAGRSFLPAATGRGASRHVVFAEGEESGVSWEMVVTRRYKVVRFSDGSEFLYDLLRDPDETADLSARPDRARVMAALRERWRRWSTGRLDPRRLKAGAASGIERT